jgi:hypothetical protein
MISYPGILAHSSTNLDTSNLPLDGIFLWLGYLDLSQTKTTGKCFVAHMFQVILSLDTTRKLSEVNGNDL